MINVVHRDELGYYAFTRVSEKYYSVVKYGDHTHDHAKIIMCKDLNENFGYAKKIQKNFISYYTLHVEIRKFENESRSVLGLEGIEIINKN